MNRTEITQGFLEEAIVQLDNIGCPKDNDLYLAIKNLITTCGSKSDKSTQIGQFNLSKKNLDIIFSHRKGDFSVRLFSGALVDVIFNQYSSKSIATAMENILSGIKLFVIKSLQDPSFFHEYMMWDFNRSEKLAQESLSSLSKDEDDKILEEEKESYNQIKSQENE